MVVRAAGEGPISLAAQTLWRYKINMSTVNSANKSKRMGRPPVDSEAVNVRFERSVLDAIDGFRREQSDLPSRPEAVRRLVDKALKAD